MSRRPEDTDHLDYDDLTHEEVVEYVDEYFWGDDEVSNSLYEE